MYEINFMTCTADDVINRSITCHPRLFADHLRAISMIHGKSANEMHDRGARKSAREMAASADSAANYVLLSTDRELSFSERIQAFSVASRLQCIPPAVARDIIAR